MGKARCHTCIHPMIGAHGEYMCRIYGFKLKQVAKKGCRAYVLKDGENHPTPSGCCCEKAASRCVGDKQGGVGVSQV